MKYLNNPAIREFRKVQERVPLTGYCGCKMHVYIQRSGEPRMGSMDRVNYQFTYEKYKVVADGNTGLRRYANIVS